jgi:hypothetical protein
MRLSLILGVCIVMCCAVVAQATLMDVVVNSTDSRLFALTGQTNGHVYSSVFSYTRTALSSSVDELDIYINNLAAMHAGVLPQLEGTWTASNGMGIVQKKGSSTRAWYLYTDPAYAPDIVADGGYATYVNLPYNTSSGQMWIETPGGTFPTGNTTDSEQLASETSLYGSWFTGGTGLGTNGLLASVFVTTNANVSFHSTLNSDRSAIGGIDISGVQFQGDFTTGIPEPSTLFLVASGLVGLLCYAWRKRR